MNKSSTEKGLISFIVMASIVGLYYNWHCLYCNFVNVKEMLKRINIVVN
jgi:hypothetical protein